MNLLSRIILGTVQFGIDYGINNQAGIPDQKKVDEILDYAQQSGIRFLDTASAYGSAETKIGDYHRRHDHRFSCITKLPVEVESKNVEKDLEQSVAKLNTNIYAVLVHNLPHFKSDPKLAEALKSAKKSGLTQKIGFSIYHPEDIDFLFDNDLEFDVLQFPYSVFDRRFEPHFEKLKKQNIEIHTRSSFLQGLFFKPLNTLPPRFESVREKLEVLKSISTKYEIELSHLLLGFCLNTPKIDCIVIGVDTIENLKENIKVEDHLSKINEMRSILEEFKVEDTQITVPTNWK